jgi:hypothetical protein
MEGVVVRMSDERSTAEIVADLRYRSTSLMLWENHKVQEQLAEAADRLEALDADMRTMHRTVVHECCEKVVALNVLRPLCPTCGGDKQDPRQNTSARPCPDCPDGRVPWERLVNVFNAVHDPEHLDACDHGDCDGEWRTRQHLRRLR